jgi:hypothetical protein
MIPTGQTALSKQKGSRKTYFLFKSVTGINKNDLLDKGSEMSYI